MTRFRKLAGALCAEQKLASLISTTVTCTYYYIQRNVVCRWKCIYISMQKHVYWEPTQLTIHNIHRWHFPV